MKRLISLICIITVMISSLSIVVSADTGTENNVAGNTLEEEQDIIEADVVCGEKASTYVSLEKSRYQKDEIITINLTIDDASKCENISFNSNGLEMIEETITEYGRSVGLRFVSSADEGNIDINIEYSGEEISHSVYAISTDKGIFVSQGSVFNAWDKYFYCGVEEGEYSFEEYNKRMIQYMNETSDTVVENVRESSNPMIKNSTRNSDITTISGTIRWVDDNGVAHPLQYNNVVAYDDTYSMILGYGKTSVSGEYSIAFSTDAFSSTVCVVVYAGNDEGMVKTMYGTTYQYYSSNISGIYAGREKIFSFDITMAATLGQAIQISQPVNVSAEYVRAMTGNYMPDAVTVKYPYAGEKDVCHYDNGTKTIFILAPNSDDLQIYADWDGIMHEYGHHIEHGFNITAGVRGPHELREDLWKYGKDHGTKLAWAEAYASFFGILAQEYFCDLSSYTVSAYLGRNIQGVGDRIVGDINLEFSTVLQGEACEGCILGILWDLYDDSGTNEPHDTISTSHQTLFQMITGGNIKTLSDLSMRIVANYETKISGFGKILAYHGISPSIVTYNSNHRRISWYANGTNDHPNNQFMVQVLNDFDYPIFSKTVTTDFLELTTAEVEMIVEDCGTQIVVYAFQTDSPITGGYPSEYVRVDF